jgi:hypothetical protein
MGPTDSSWIKVQLTNGEEAFFYPDDDETVSIKELKPGLQVVHRELRRCKKPGQTRWLTSAHSIQFQPEATRKYLIEKTPKIPEIIINTEETEEEDIYMQSREPITTRNTFDGPTSHWLRELVSKSPYSHNKYGVSRMVSEIVSEAKATGVMDKYYRIEEGARK